MNINLADLPLKIAYQLVSDIQVNQDITAFNKLKNLASDIRGKYKEFPVNEIPGVQDARSLFRSVGIDPTRRRPSSEALLRRALKGQDFYQVNNIVDAGNFASLKFLLPICMYDYDAIKEPILVKLGSSQDSYQAHNHRQMNFENKLVIVDGIGAFGSPLTDSLRTAVTERTRNLLIIIFAPATYDSDQLNSNLQELKELIV